MNGFPRFSLCLVALGLFSAPTAVFAWGERGHHTICEVAAHLVRDPELSAFLRNRTEVLGHVCNIPDISWRSLGDYARIGDVAHYMNAGKCGPSIREIPLDYREFLRLASARVPDPVQSCGSLWWRVDQFYRRAVRDGTLVARSPFPLPGQGQDMGVPYNAAVAAMLTDMGLMGHFVGDASQPFHATSDFDGWESGHGGIHMFFETDAVGIFSFGLTQEVYQRGLQLQRKSPLSGAESVVASVKALSQVAADEIGLVLRLDQLLVASSRTTGPGGKPIEIPAKRPPLEIAAPRLEPVIAVELARSAYLLAYLWDRLYVEAGRPKLSAYQSYKYPLSPRFIKPDYLP